MHRHLVLTAAALALAAAAPAPAAAQLRMPPVRLITGLGPMQASSIGFLHSANGEFVHARHLASNSVMLGLEAGTPIRGVDLRLSVTDADPMITLSGPGMGYNSQVVAPTNVTTLSLDAVIRLPHLRGLQPYVLVGGGFKRYDFDQRYFRLSEQPVVPRDEVDAMLRAGAGVAWNVGRVDLFTEFGATTSRFKGTQYPTGEMVQNYTWTAGVRVPLHR